jgi:hypothetical protein
MRVMRAHHPRAWIVVSSFAVPIAAYAGAVLDADGDLVPDQFDNCRLVANGLNQLTNQVDADLDGSETVTTADFSIFLGKFSGVGAANRPGPSGLACSDPTIRIDLGQAPCTH